ncbi:hypothetical protein [Salinicoccus bachuensis]|uniref:Uncharacterized protein n=1 Tax=Salinicoccus bachuensis TaxID=3136731 RepID=A0ABZ3CED6_9STAP
MPMTRETIVPTSTYSLSLWTALSEPLLGNRRMDFAVMISPIAVYWSNSTNRMIRKRSLYPVK